MFVLDWDPSSSSPSVSLSSESSCDHGNGDTQSIRRLVQFNLSYRSPRHRVPPSHVWDEHTHEGMFIHSSHFTQFIRFQYTHTHTHFSHSFIRTSWVILPGPALTDLLLRLCARQLLFLALGAGSSSVLSPGARLAAPAGREREQCIDEEPRLIRIGPVHR